MPMLMAFLAGFIYIIAPGPVFLALVGTVAEKGHPSGIRLVSGSIIGDLFWIGLALASLIYSYAISQNIFHLLAIACGLYLIYLGINALRAKKEKSSSASKRSRSTPFLMGLTLGFLNPKSYPVLLATIAGFLHSYIDSRLAILAPSICLGVVVAYACMITICSIRQVKSFYIRHTQFIVRFIGIIFVFFGVELLRNVYLAIAQS